MRIISLNKSPLLSILVLLLLSMTVSASDSVEWSIQKTFQLQDIPKDVAISKNGKRIFVLTDKGEIIIYSSFGKMEGKIKVGRHVDKIQVDPGDNRLILNSRENKTVQIINIDFIQMIDISGSPFKGPKDAPIVIAAFDDFQ